MRHALTALAVLLFLSASAVWLAADSVPDPVIGIRGGSGTIGFFGTATIDLANNGPGGDVTGDCFTSAGCLSNVFGNLGENGVITSFLEVFATPQQAPGPDQPIFSASADSIFQGINILSNTQVIIFSLDPGTHNISNGCTFVEDELSCPPNSEFQLEFFNVTQGASNLLTFTSNPVPEPSTIALLASGLGALGIGRKKWWGKRA